jgi:hypothetical protein
LLQLKAEEKETHVLEHRSIQMWWVGRYSSTNPWRGQLILFYVFWILYMQRTWVYVREHQLIITLVFVVVSEWRIFISFSLLLQFLLRFYTGSHVCVRASVSHFMQWRTGGGVKIPFPPKFQTFDKLSRIPSSVENTSVTT